MKRGIFFTLGTNFSAQMKANFTDENGNEKPMIMGCYGIGLGRIMGSVVEVHNDEKGIIWPKELAPFHIHLIALESKDKKTSKRFLRRREKFIRNFRIRQRLI